MVDVSNKHKNITVEVSNKHKSFTVEVENKSGNTNVTASSDTAQYWANQSHTYANQSRESAQEAKEYAELANSYIENFEGVVVNAETELTALKDASVQEINTAVTDGKTEVNTAKDLAIDAVNNTKTTILQDIEFVADGEKKEIEDLIDSGKDEIQELTNEIKENASDIINRVSLSMFDTILKDHVLTYEETKGLALQGTYVYKNAIAGERYGYPDFYNQVLKEWSEATTTETVNGATVKVHANGHKFYSIGYKTKIDEFFTSTGSAWFYGLDTENERIFLPRNNWFEQMTGNVAEVGDSIQAGLPNITGTFDTQELSYTTTGEATGALYKYTSKYGLGANGASKSALAIGFDASKSNAIYGKSTTVQPNAVKKLLYICVGNTVSDTSWVDVVTQVEGGVKDLEDATNEGLQALSNASNALRQNQITNCLLEVPQRIKYTLENGTLTIKAGSVVIVPYGVEDLTAQYPKGTTFIHENFKVYDTQYTNGKFFVWVELVSDIIASTTSSGTLKRYVTLDLTTNILSSVIQTESGTATTTQSYTYNYTGYYNTSTNLIGYTNNTTTIGYINIRSFPFMSVVADGTYMYGSITQVFNGMGYIGSTAWVDKGVKGLIPNGRNEDGSLNNIEFTTDEMYMRTFTFNTSQVEHLTFLPFHTNKIGVISSQNLVQNWQDLNYLLDVDGQVYQGFMFATGKLTSGVVSNFQPKQVFRALDYNDKQEIISWGIPDYNSPVDITSSLTKGSTYTIPFDGVIRFYVNQESEWCIVKDKNNTSSATALIFINGASGIYIDSYLSVYKNQALYVHSKGTSAIFYPLKGAN